MLPDLIIANTWTHSSSPSSFHMAFREMKAQRESDRNLTPCPCYKNTKMSARPKTAWPASWLGHLWFSVWLYVSCYFPPWASVCPPVKCTDLILTAPFILGIPPKGLNFRAALAPSLIRVCMHAYTCSPTGLHLPQGHQTGIAFSNQLTPLDLVWCLF